MQEIGKGWRQLRTTINVNALNATITCRDRDKIPCDGASVEGGSAGEWCYRSVNRLVTAPTVLQSSRDLVLSANYADTDSRVWVTDGPRITENGHYTDSLEVVMEGKPVEDHPVVSFNLTVCSSSAVLVSGIGTASGVLDTPQNVEYFNHVLLSNGTTIKPRRILFHETWLDFGYYVDTSESPDHGSTSTTSKDPFSYSNRPRASPPGFNLFGMFGNNTRQAGSRSNAVGHQTSASAIEVTVGGALLYLLS